VKRRFLAALLMGLPLVIALATPASASGTTGRWSLIDTVLYPGATCFFHTTPDDELHRIRVRAPVIYAVDRTSAVDRQTVGWRWTIQVSDNGGVTYHGLRQGPIVTATATDRYNAQWPSLSSTFVRVGNLHAAYRAVVTMIWYTPGGAIGGTQRATVAHYVDHFNGADQAPGDHCHATLG
jgi:hypothetical protein